MYDYSRQLRGTEAAVHLVCEDPSHRRGGLGASIDDAAARYDFTFAQVRDLADALRRPAGAVLSHVIWAVDRPFSPDLLEGCQRLLAHHDTVSLATTYGSEAEMLAQRAAIEAAKRFTRGRVNFMRPDTVLDGKRRVSLAKITDNSVCDSVRVKYRAIRERAFDKAAAQIVARELPWFRAASAAYARHHLWHRAPSDGYFARRVPEGLLITATKTSKVDLDPGRIVLVLEYDEIRNTLHYAGPYLPSSDAVEAAVLFAERPDVREAIHTHASDRFTRNPDYQARVVVGQLPYGEPELGRAVRAALDTLPDGFLIMEEHGEVFAAGDRFRFVGALDAIEHFCAAPVRGASVHAHA